MKNKWSINKIIFWVLIIIGILIRIYNFPIAISEINCDEIMTIVNAKSILDTGKDIDGISLPVYLHAWGGQSVVLLYLMVLTIKIFGYTLFASRLPLLIMSIISLFIFYDLLKKISNNEKVALIGLGLVVIAPWQILQSIWALDCNMFPHFLLIAMDLLYTGVQKSKRALLYIAMVFFGICLYCYGLAIYFVPIFLIIIAIYLKKKDKVKYKDIFISIAVFAIVALPIITMFILNLFKLESIVIGDITIPYYPNLAREKDMLFFSENFIMQLLENIKSTFQVIFIQSDDMEWNSVPMFGTIYYISIIFFLIGVIVSIKNMKKEKDNFGKVILILWLIMSIFTGFVANKANINRLNSVWYPMLLFSAFGIYFIYNKIKYKKIYKYSMIFIYSILFITYSIYLYGYHVEKINNSGCFSRGFCSSIEYSNNTSYTKIFYDNINNDGNLPLYANLKQKEGKNYYIIKSKEELQEKLSNLAEDEILIIKNENIGDIDSSELIKFGEYNIFTKIK